MARPTTRPAGPAGPGTAARPRSRARAGGRRRRAGGRGSASARAGEGRVGRDRRAGDRPGLVRRDGPVDAVAGVLRTEDDHQLGDFEPVEDRRRELARVDQARVRHHGRRPGFRAALAGGEQAVDQPRQLAGVGRIERPATAAGRVRAAGTGRGDEPKMTSGSVDCAARLNRPPLRDGALRLARGRRRSRSSGVVEGAKAQALLSCSSSSKARRAGSKPRRSGAASVPCMAGSVRTVSPTADRPRAPTRLGQTLARRSRRGGRASPGAAPRAAATICETCTASDRPGSRSVRARPATLPSGHAEEVVVRRHPLDQRHDVLPRVPRPAAAIPRGWRRAADVMSAGAAASNGPPNSTVSKVNSRVSSSSQAVRGQTRLAADVAEEGLGVPAVLDRDARQEQPGASPRGCAARAGRPPRRRSGRGPAPRRPEAVKQVDVRSR